MKLVLFPARLFLALGWIRAGVEKAIDEHWWTGDHLRGFLEEQSSHMLPIVTPLAPVLDSYGALASAVVLLVEFVIGLSLLTGHRLRPALLVASGLNVVFVVFGAVTPSAFYLVLQITLLGAIAARRSVPAWRTWLTVGLCSAGSLALTPMIGTLHPAEVIDDPAIMLATLAMLVATTKMLPLLAERIVDSPTR